MARGSIYAAPVNTGAILRCYSGQVRWRSYTDRVLPVAAASHAAPVNVDAILRCYSLRQAQDRQDRSFDVTQDRPFDFAQDR